jgi:hypothetical protein
MLERDREAGELRESVHYISGIISDMTLIFIWNQTYSFSMIRFHNGLCLAFVFKLSYKEVPIFQYLIYSTFSIIEWNAIIVCSAIRESVPQLFETDIELIIPFSYDI